MANVRIVKQTQAKYDDHHYHMYKIGDIHAIGGALMPQSLATAALAAGWAVSDVNPVVNDTDPSEDVQNSQVGAKQKPVVSKDGS